MASGALAKYLEVELSKILNSIIEEHLACSSVSLAEMHIEHVDCNEVTQKCKIIQNIYKLNLSFFLVFSK